MAAESGRAADALTADLFEEPYRFDFFQAVHLLEQLYPDREPVGRSGGSPSREVVRFRTPASLAFPASPIQSLEGGTTGGGEEDDPDATSSRPEMVVNFMGLTGPSGTLPYHYTEHLIDRKSQPYNDTAYWEFLDIFSHRMISLFYRAWEKYRFQIPYERGERGGLTQYLFDIIGLGTPGLKGRLGMEDEGLLFYGGLIAQRPRSATAIASILSDHYGVPVAVEQFLGQWLALDDDSLTRLGGDNSHLGVDFVAGEGVWNCQSKFRLSFGPLTFREFLSLLPGGAHLDSAVKLTRLLVGLEFDFDVELTLRAEEVPEWHLGGDPDAWPMLGWTSWLKTQKYSDGNDPCVVLQTVE